MKQRSLINIVDISLRKPGGIQANEEKDYEKKREFDSSEAGELGIRILRLESYVGKRERTLYWIISLFHNLLRF